MFVEGVHLKRSLFWKLLCGLLVILALGASFYLLLGRRPEVSLTQQLLDRQQLIARAEASNIIIFFEKHGDSVATLAQIGSIKQRDADVLENLDTFIEQRKDTGIIGGVGLTDKQGIVQYISNISGTRDTGQSVSDRNYFTWAKSEAKKGEYYISRPMVSRGGATKGQTIVAVVSPVFRNNTFTGVLTSSVKLQPLLERFLGLMKVSHDMKVYLVNEGGDLMYSNNGSDSFGSSIFEIFSEDQIFKDKIKNALTSTKEDQFQTDQHLVVYSPLSLGVQKWLLIISSPAFEVGEQVRPFYIRQAVIFIATALIILLFVTVAIRKSQV